MGTKVDHEGFFAQNLSSNLLWIDAWEILVNGNLVILFNATNLAMIIKNLQSIYRTIMKYEPQSVDLEIIQNALDEAQIALRLMILAQERTEKRSHIILPS